MKRKGYRFGVAWIAANDNEGGDDALNAEAVAGYISVCLLADLFGKEPADVARDVVKHRREHS